MDKLKDSKLLKIVMLTTMLIFAGMVIVYYWNSDSLESMKYIPMRILIFVFGYILIQISKRFVFRKQNWWDWLYYIGLIAVILPVYFVSDTSLETFQMIAKIGTISLVIPIVFDLIQLIKSRI
tara:strand:- start:11659 stop:12027 length:369 start_codon:yes stop_codon:yes gene_type:complete